MKFLRLLPLALFLLAFSTASSAGDDSELLVIIKEYKFIPQHITIKQGQNLVWENREKRQYHSVWFETLGEEEPEDYLFPEDTYERSFTTPGTYPYRCGPHPEMLGSVTVTE
ncbi:MAG: plastocyanin [Gammaproteobacteria bacterium]|nr:plastocyanin [Gammaproteobacteria bacterium]